jgi:cytochrome P450
MTVPVDLPAPFGSAWARDPWPEYTRLRSAGGITRIPLRRGLNPWVVTGYRLVRTLLGDPRLSANADHTTPEVRAAILAGQPEERVNLIGRSLLTVDPPDHTRLRRILSSALSAQRAADLAEPIRRTADRFLDRLVGRDEADLLADYAIPLTATVACSLIGIPEEAHEQFCAWGLALTRAELHSATAFDDVTAKMLDHFLPLLDSRLRQPRDDLVSLLAAARNEDQLDDYELVSVVYQLFFAGYETTGHLLANAILRLLDHPVERAAMAADPQLLAAGVEELLRIEGSVKVPSWRFAVAPVDVGDVTIQPGEPVLAVLASANRDEALVADPEEFRLDRDTNPHLAFGYGIHHCLGAAVGRLELRVGLARLLARFPGVGLALPADELCWRVNLLIRGVRELPVRLGAHVDGV